MDQGKSVHLEWPYNATNESFKCRISIIKEDIICTTLQKGRVWH